MIIKGNLKNGWETLPLPTISYRDPEKFPTGPPTTCYSTPLQGHLHLAAMRPLKQGKRTSRNVLPASMKANNLSSSLSGISSLLCLATPRSSLLLPQTFTLGISQERNPPPYPPLPLRPYWLAVLYVWVQHHLLEALPAGPT